jgi:hypothetical protein
VDGTDQTWFYTSTEFEKLELKLFQKRIHYTTKTITVSPTSQQATKDYNINYLVPFMEMWGGGVKNIN